MFDVFAFMEREGAESGKQLYETTNVEDSSCVPNYALYTMHLYTIYALNV